MSTPPANSNPEFAASQKRLDAAIAAILREAGVAGPDRVAQTMHRLQQAYYCSDIACPHRLRVGGNVWPVPVAAA